MIYYRTFLVIGSLTASLLISCSKFQFRLTVKPVTEKLPVDTVAIYPFKFIHKHQPYQAYEKTNDLISGVFSLKKFWIVGPEEFKRYRPGTHNVFATSSLLFSTSKMGLDPLRLLVLSGSVHHRISKTRRGLVDRAGRLVGMRNEYASLYHIHLALLHPATNKVLVKGTCSVRDDLIRMKEASDPHPVLRVAIRDLLRALFDAVEEHLIITDKKSRLDLAFVANHSRIFTHTVGGKVPLAILLRKKDFLEEEAARLTRYQYFYPEITIRQIFLFNAHPHGLLVTDLDEEKLYKAGLRMGDLILSMNGKPLLGEYQFRRTMGLAKPGSRHILIVIRKGKKLLLNFIL